MSYPQPNCCLKIDSQKVDQHAGSKWLIRDICILFPMLTPFQGTTNVYGQHKDSPIVVGNLKSGYQYTVMVCRVNGNAQSPDWSVKNVCAIQFCKIGSGATVVIMAHLNIKR